MKHLRHILIGILLLLTSCIENSIPYPVVTLQILGVEGEGFTCSPEDINTQERIVTLHLDEQTDISNVKIDKISVTENARSSKPLSGTFDLRTPLYLTLSFYQDYEWTIVADQQIERYFEVESQIGAAEIDVDQLTAKAYVPEGTDLSDLKVTRLKLGPADITTMTPPIDELTSFESVRYVYVAYHDFEEKWSLYVEATDTKVRFTQVDAWSGVIWAYAEGNSADELGFRYRKTGDEAWTEVDKKQINISGGAFDTCITGLTPETQYEVVAYSGSNETEVASVTTEAAPQLPNGGFEEWETIDKVVYPYLADGIHFWNSGNKGASIGNATPTDKTTDVRPGTSGIYAAQLSSKLAGLVGVYKLAAGNLFTGIFYGIRNLTHGLDFFFNERFLFVNDKMAEKRHGCQTVFYFLFIGNLWNRCCGSCGFLFSKHKRFLLFKYHADHRLVYMLVIILFATADNAKVWSERGHVFCICRKISLFFVEQIPVDTVNG